MGLLLGGSALIALATTLGVFVWLENRSHVGISVASDHQVGPGGPPKERSSNLHEVLLARSRKERVVSPWLKQLDSIFNRATPQGRVKRLYDMARTAGIQRKWTPRRIAATRIILALVGIVVGIGSWFALKGLLGLIFAAIVIGIGFRGLDVFLANRSRLRQEAITHELPNIADQIAITVQAGLGFEQAIRRMVASTDGPLAAEFGRFLQDLRVGQSRARAFKLLQERVDVPDVTSFVRAIAQAEKTGVSVAEMLQIQADELRQKRRQRAEERAQRLPVVMLMPLATCVLPALMIVLLGPAMIEISRNGFGV